MVALQDSLALKNIVSQFLEKRHTAYRHLTITTPIRRKRGFSKLPTRYLTPIQTNLIILTISKLPTRYLTWRSLNSVYIWLSKLPTRYLTGPQGVNATFFISKLPTRYLTWFRSFVDGATISKLPTRYLTRTFLFIFLYCKRIFANFYDFDPFFGLILILLIINKLKTVLKKGSINLKIRDGCCFA